MANVFIGTSTILILCLLAVLVSWATYRRIKKLLLTKGLFSKYSTIVTMLFGVVLVAAMTWMVMVMIVNLCMDI